MVVGQVLGTDLLVLKFQASVNKPFINFPALWRVSCPHSFRFMLSVLGDSCTPSFPWPVHRELHCGQTLNLSELFASSALPLFRLLFALLIPFFIFWVLSIPTEANTGWQKRPPGTRVHLGMKEGGAVETISSMCPLSLIISPLIPYFDPLCTTLPPSPCCLAAIC